MANDGGRLGFMAVIGFLLIQIGMTGKPGSILAAIIDPGSLQEGTGSSSSGSGPASGQPVGAAPVNVATSGTLTPYEIAWYAQRAGFSGKTTLTIAVAIALAESGGRTDATHQNSNGTTDRGLWQINSVHSQYDAKKLLTPAYNAGAAFLISGGGANWNPWTTYKMGAYLSHMSAAAQGVAQLTVLGGT